MKDALNGNSDEKAESVRAQIVMMECKVSVFKEDVSDSSEAEGLVPLIDKSTPIHFLINSAAILSLVHRKQLSSTTGTNTSRSTYLPHF